MGHIFSKRNQNSPQSIIYGVSTFQIKHEEVKKLEALNEENWKMLQDIQWNIQNLQFVKKDWTSIFSKIQSTKVQRLSLYRSGSLKLFQEINHIKFENLQLLALGKNNISNIEALSFMDLPGLKILRLNENHITNFQPLNKMMSKQLKCLVLQQNPFIVLKQFHRIKFNCDSNQGEVVSKLLLQERISHWNSSQSKMHDNITFLMKLQMKQLKTLNLQESILRKKHRKRFSKKNLNDNQA